YEWSPISPQQENNIVSPSTTTTYYVTATDQNECSAWDNITVEVEDIQISSSVAYEYGNSTGTVDFVFVPSNISTTDFSQITIVNNQTSELFDFTGLNDPYTLDAGYNYTASFVSINGCIYTNEFSIIFAENFICSTIVNPITCEYNYNGSIELDIQGGVSPYIAYVFLDGNIFNYTFNTPGIHTIDLSGTPPTNSTISISITDSNGAVSTHLVNGIDFAWENGITLTNDNLGSQVNFSNIAIQLGNASNQSLIIHQDVTFTNCTIYTATHPYSNVSETQWTVYNPYTLKLENTIVKSGCPDQMWQGIRGIIVGEVIFDDNPTPIAPSQLLIYTSEIHDAIKAVEAANGSLGAVVIKAKNSKFYNNVYDLYFDWSNFPQSNCLIRGNEFITNDILNNPNLYPKAHVYMNYVSGITFSNNHFENTILYMPLMPSDVMYTTNKRGIGIEANFSSFTVTQPNHTYPSLTPLWTNSFEGLYYGIIAKGQNTYAPRIYHNNFTNNFRGVYMRDVNGARLLFNDFETAKYNLSFDYIGIPINAGLPATNVSYAAYIANCNNFKIEENSIKNGEAGLYVYNTGEAAGLEVYKNSFGDGDTPGNYNMKAGTIVVGKNSNFISNDIYNQGLNGLQTRCNTYTSTENAISVINGNMRKNQGAQYGQTNELAGNQFNDTYSPAMDFKVQIHTGNSLLWDFSRFDLGRYNYWQHENDESLDFYTQLDNFSELKIQTYTLSVFNPLNSCLTNYPGPVIIDAELELSTASALRSSATGKENQYNDLIDRGDTEYLINLTESMSNRNFNSIFPILCNDGYLSDIVFETILDNRSTNRPRIATVLISNSPLPDNIMEMVENSAYLKNGHKKQIRKVQVGTSPRLIFEYEIADIKQDISKIESNLINHAIDNDSVPAIRETVINYLINNAEINSINYVNRFNLQLAQTDIIEAKNTLDDLRFYATSLQNENIATEIERYCDVHDIYISLLQDTVYDKALLVQNQEFLREAALDFSPLYSGKAQTLYEMATDSTFIEYTPLPFEEILPRSVIIEQEDDIFMADLNIYPNPTRDKLYIEYNFQSYSEEGNEELLQILGYKEKENCISGEIKIYTIDGKLIISKTLEQPSGIETIDMQNYPPASYIIKITDCYGFTKELKFVKQ
ncbi:MAG: hypothetical protein PHW82_14080, partial [Bacteroidales bacterium]|nr:hypothetical protein [Bacteroidales bacterium]